MAKIKAQAEACLAAGQQRNALRVLAGRPGDDLDAAGADVFGVGELQMCRTAVEQLLEQPGKLLAHSVEGAAQLDLHALVEFGDDLLDVGQRCLQVCRLREQELVTSAASSSTRARHPG